MKYYGMIESTVCSIRFGCGFMSRESQCVQQVLFDVTESPNTA